MALNVVVGVDVGIGMCVSVGILSQYEHDMSQRKLTRSSQGATWELVTVVGNQSKGLVSYLEQRHAKGHLITLLA